jgi:flagellar basal body-associated protein FliL
MNKKILILGTVGLALLGGGGGAYYMFGLKKEPEQKVEPVVVKAPPIFVQLEQMSVPILQGERVNAYYFVAVSLQVADEGKRTTVNERMPLIKDAFLRDVYTHSAMRSDAPDSLDFDALKQRFMNLSQQILGPGVVEDVLITRAIKAVG